MKTGITTMLFFVAGIAIAEPRFVGVVDGMKEGLQFIIKPSDNGSARWLKLGDSIEGYRLSEFLANNETLIAEKAGHQIRWKLKEAKVVSSAPDKAGKAASELIPLEAARKKLADAQERLTKLREERKQALERRRASNNPPPQEK